MFLVTANKPKRLLYFSYIHHVSVEDLQRGRKDAVALLADFPPGLHLLSDLGRMESMDIACVDEIGKMMELLEQHGVELIVRVIPDSSKDIGFNILARFHYRNAPRAVNCKTMTEAARLLTL